MNDLGVEAPIKSVGNSTTTPRDLVNDEDVRLVLYLFEESVSERLRENHMIHPHSYLEHVNRSGCEAALCAESI